MTKHEALSIAGTALAGRVSQLEASYKETSGEDRDYFLKLLQEKTKALDVIVDLIIEEE